MAIGDAMVAPAGLQNQMYGQPTRVPGYDQGLSQAPGQMALPPEPMPIGRPTAVVGGPAYFTPQGYNAPPQPTQAFMPTDVRPDPIGQQFMRQMESPMGQQFQQQYEATQAPIREAEAAARAEAQAAQDARFQEMMDRIAELEGQLATPTPSPVPEPEPFVPGGPFPGIPDFIRDLDFSGLPNFDIDYDDLMDQYRDRMEMGEPEPIESFLPDLRDLPPMSPGGTPGFDMTRELPREQRGENRNLASGLNFVPRRSQPTGLPRPEGMSEKFAQQLTDKGIDLADKNYLYQPKMNLVTTGSRERFIPMPQPIELNPDYVPPVAPPANIPNIGAIKPVSMEKINNNRSMIPSFGNFNLR